MELTREVRAFASVQLLVEEITYRWSVQDYMTMDKVPYHAPILPFSEDIYIATSFSVCGMTHETVAKLLLRNLVLDHENEWADMYDPNRMLPA